MRVKAFRTMPGTKQGHSEYKPLLPHFVDWETNV